MATIREISDRAGVSIATVSKVLNNKSGVKQETADRILQIADQLNYRPNLNARSLKLGDARTIGIITEDLTVFNTPEIVDGVASVCETLNYHYILSNLRFNKRYHDNPWDYPESNVLVRSAVNDLLSKQVAGIIYIGCHSHLVASLKAHAHIPFVCVYCTCEDQDVPCVGYDDRLAAYEATGTLLEHTSEHIGMITGPIHSVHTLRRANGFYTYFAADIAYHRNKFAVRGFDKVVNIWGADHHGHVARLKGAMDALGLDGEHRQDIVLMQLVKLVRDGEVVRMSKRTGKAISLTDLLDEIPVDACRWFFNAKPDTQMEFDLGLAVREDSENPVYYVQYAYARICTLLKALAAEGYDVPAAADADLALLTADEEKALIKQLAQYPVVVRLAARDYDPSFINRYLSELAAAFHKFYNACRIKGEEKNVLLARLKLADTARAVLKNGMTLIGCSAPEKM